MKNLFDLSGKTALITGGGGLLGPKHAEAIVEYGGKVILADWHEDRAKKKAAQIGDSATYHYMDVTDKKSVENRAGKQHTAHTAYATQRTAYAAEALLFLSCVIGILYSG